MELPVNNQVISSLINASTQGRKTKYVPIGPDLRYIGRLPGSNVNNFEEEYLLGEDKQITRSYTVDADNVPCYKEVIKYRKNDNVTSNYYELECFEYDLRPQREDITVDDDKMIINLHSRLENLPQVAGTILRKYKLYWYYAPGQRELLSWKDVESRIEQDNNDARKQIEIIRKQDSPMDANIYFENGTFNPELVPTGFDFNNNTAIYDYSDESNLISSGGYKTLADVGTIAILQKNAEYGQNEHQQLINDTLQFSHTYKEDQYYDNAGERLLLPVVNQNMANRYVNIQYKLTQNGEGNILGVCIVSYQLENGGCCGAGSEYYDSCNTSLEVNYPVALEEASIENINQNYHDFTSMNMITIEALAEYYEPNQTFEIIKIQGSETPVNQEEV